MKFISLLLLITFSYVESFGQNNLQYSAPFFNQYNINPAIAGIEDQLDISAVFRKQWANVAESPTAQNISLHIPFDMLAGGIGINISNQSSGAERWTMAKLGYAYHFQINEYSQLNIGGALGLINSSIDGAQLRTPDGTYINGVINHADADLPLSKVSSSTYIGDIGAYFVNDKLTASISYLGLLGGELNFESGFNSLVTEQSSVNLFLAYNLDFLQSITIIPHVYLKTDFVKTQSEFHLIGRYNDNLILGGGLRGYDGNSLDAFIATIGVELKNGMTMLYAYDYTLSALDTISSGSHEFVIKYSIDTRLGKGRLPGIIYNPRNL
ncbi:MAG: PorP/SprF family type IX secretion system membrane protein [Bacteroidia bacterium]|nr:PorP/SprF family type IX secretion system membrane protein [Bacteroidia bacterium]